MTSDNQRVREMLEKVGASSGVSSDLVASLYEVRPRQRELNDLLNSYKDAGGSPTLRKQIKAEIGRRFEHFVATGGDGHSTPDWIIPTMQSCIVATLDESPEGLARCLELDLDSLDNAQTDWQRAIAHGNLSESYRALGDYDQAILHGLAAVEIDPRNHGFLAYLALATIQKAGEDDTPATRATARQVLAAIEKNIDVTAEQSVMRGYLLTYREFREAAREYEELERLYQRIEASRRRAGRGGRHV